MFGGAGLTIRSIEHVINPTVDMEKVKESGNKYQQGNLKIANLTKSEFLNSYTYQYILIAQKEYSSETVKVDSTNSGAPGGNLQLPRFQQDNVVPQLSSFIILTFNELEYTKKCVQKLPIIRRNLSYLCGQWFDGWYCEMVEGTDERK